MTGLHLVLDLFMTSHDLSYNTPAMVLYILPIFLHSTQQKWDQGTLGTQRSTLVGSRTRLGPSMDPAWPYNTLKMALY